MTIQEPSGQRQGVVQPAYQTGYYTWRMYTEGGKGTPKIKITTPQRPPAKTGTTTDETAEKFLGGKKGREKILY